MSHGVIDIEQLERIIPRMRNDIEKNPAYIGEYVMQSIDTLSKYLSTSGVEATEASIFCIIALKATAYFLQTEDLFTDSGFAAASFTESLDTLLRGFNDYSIAVEEAAEKIVPADATIN